MAAHLRMSGNHRRYASWTVERIRQDARKIAPGDGPAVWADPGGEASSRAGLSHACSPLDRLSSLTGSSNTDASRGDGSDPLSSHPSVAPISWSSTISSSSPLDAGARHDLLEILIGDPTYADAILDRVVHNAHASNSLAWVCAGRAPRSQNGLTANLERVRQMASVNERGAPGPDHLVKGPLSRKSLGAFVRVGMMKAAFAP
jgi:hypothetical protein